MSVAGGSGASLDVENTNRSTRSFQRSIPLRKIEAARLSHPARAVVAAIPRSSFRRVIKLLTAPPGDHRNYSSWMENNQDNVVYGEEEEQNETTQVHDARGIVAAE